MDEKAFEEKLKRFGLSEKEIETYRTILQYGEVKASVVSKEADVSNRYVYSISEELEDRNLIEIDDHVSPTVLRAKPPGEVGRFLVDESKLLQSEIEDRYEYRATAEKEFQVIKSRRTVYKRVRDLVAEANQEVILSIPAIAFDEVADVLAEARERGLLTLVLLSGVEGDEDVVDEAASTANVLRTWDTALPLLLTIDDEVGFVSPYELLRTPGSDAEALSVANSHIMSFMYGTFIANYWPVSAQHSVRGPSELPRTYRCFRHAVFDAAVHTAEGADLTVSADATPTDEEADRYETVSGTVTDVYQNLVEPVSGEFPLQSSIAVDTGDGTVSLGGPSAFVEDYETRSLTLDTPE